MQKNPQIAIVNQMPRSLIALIGATPLLLAAAPLAFTPEPSNWQAFLRIYSFVVAPIELLAVYFLMHNGGSVIRGWNALPSISKWAIFALSLISIYTSFQPSADHFSAAVGLFRVAFSGLLALAFLGSSGYGNQDWKLLWYSLALGAVAYFGLFAIYVTSNSLEVTQWVSPFPGFNNLRHVAFLGLIGFGGGLGCLILSENTPGTAVCLTFTALFGVPALTFVLWTGSRGPLLAILFMTICCLAVFGRRRKVMSLFFLASLALGITIASVLPLPNPMYGVMQALGLSDVSAQNLNTASSGRLEIWQYTFVEVLKRPYFGWGLNQFEHFFPESQGQLFHPHNYPLQLLFASGFVGAMLLAVAVTATAWPRVGEFQSEAQKFNALFTLTLLLYSLYDGILYFSYPLLIFVVVFIGFVQPKSVPDRSD